MHPLLLTCLLLTACDGLRAFVVGHWPQQYTAKGAQAQAGGAWPKHVPFFDGPDVGLPQVPISLKPVAEGFDQPTDIQFVPGSTTELIVLEKEGRALWLDLTTGVRTEIVRLKVPIKSEQGLLGAAFHPGFAENGRIFLNHSEQTKAGVTSVVSQWKLDRATHKAETMGEVLRVEQPYANHNAGQLCFGPDGMLYIGWGDGGWRADPHGHGQNPATHLGSMLRIDVDRKESPKNYAIPPDNPWTNTPGVAPEVWAIGFRNPWRYSFAPDGRLIVADVGQDAWEEITVVSSGQNHGWSTQEGTHCFEPGKDCSTDGLTQPVYEYSHASGESITGGFVYTGTAVPALKGSYVFADFVSGRIWAIRLPESDGPATQLRALGRWTMLPSTFGQDGAGELYVADYGKGRILRLTSAASPSESR
jgi:glucose/arabinose dehydrogenase